MTRRAYYRVPVVVQNAFKTWLARSIISRRVLLLKGSLYVALFSVAVVPPPPHTRNHSRRYYITYVQAHDA